MEDLASPPPTEDAVRQLGLTFSSVPMDNARQAGQSPSHPTSWVLGAVAWLAPQAPIETLYIDRAKRQSRLDKTYRLLVPRPSLEFSGPGEGQSAVTRRR